VFLSVLLFVCLYISGQLAAKHHQELPMPDVQLISSQGEDVTCTSNTGSSW
jgi:hypothetical protein